MADNPEMPDLKKALENKPAGFAWAPVAKAAASAAGRPQAPPSKGRGKLAAGGGGRGGGGRALGDPPGRGGGAAGGGVGGAKLGGVASAMKIRFARQNDPTGFIKRESASAAGEKMRFDLIKGAADKAAAGKAGGGTGAPGAEGEGGEPMAYDEGPASRASGASAGGGAAGQGKEGDQGGAGGLAGGGAPRLNASASSVNFRGMRRVSGTAGFRSIQGGRGGAGRTIRTQGSSANPYGTASGAGGSSGGNAMPGGRASGATGVSPGSVAGGGAGSGSAAAGGGGGGGGPAIDMESIESTVDYPSQIQNLLTDAGKLREKAEGEKKKAQALKAGGHDVQAAYHYDRYQKAKDAAKEKEDEATRLTGEMESAAGSIIEEPATAP